MWAQHLQVWEVHSSQCPSLSLITKATDLLIKPLLFPCCIDTVAFHKYKMFPSLHEDASCCYTEHLKHLTHPGQKKWRGGDGIQLQTQLGPLGAPASFTEGGGTAKGNEAVKGGRRGCMCVYFEAEGLSALAGSWSHMQVVDSVARQIKKSRPRVDLPLKWEWGLDIRQKT